MAAAAEEVLDGKRSFCKHLNLESLVVHFENKRRMRKRIITGIIDRIQYKLGIFYKLNHFMII